MRKIIKKIIRGIERFLKELFGTLKWLFYFILKTDCRNHVPHVDGAERLIVLATGPSLTEAIGKIDFSSADVSAMNVFFNSPWYRKIRPRYYVIADPLLFSKEEYYAPLMTDTDWDMYLFVPYECWNGNRQLKHVPNPHITVVPFQMEVFEGFRFMKDFIYRKGLSMPKAQNVLVASIFTGINMGYKEILLYGADHSWTKTLGVNAQNQVCTVNTHFQDNAPVTFSPFWKNPDTKEAYTMQELLRAFADMFASYHEIRHFADKHGCRILNCTPDSLIDAFERLA